MTTIYKYKLNPTIEHIETFVRVQPLSVGLQYGEPVMWCLVDTSSPKIQLKVYIHSTGGMVFSPNTKQFVGTFQLIEMGIPLVFHVFTEKL